MFDDNDSIEHKTNFDSDDIRDIKLVHNAYLCVLSMRDFDECPSCIELLCKFGKEYYEKFVAFSLLIKNDLE